MSLPLKLNCLVLGNDPSLIFPVEIAGTESVGALRESIKDKKKSAFDDVPAHTLNIFMVFCPVNDDLGAVLKRFRPEHDPSNGVHYLSNPAKRLKEAFEDYIDKHIYVIVQPPRECQLLWPASISHLGIKLRLLVTSYSRVSSVVVIILTKFFPSKLRVQVPGTS